MNTDRLANGAPSLLPSIAAGAEARDLLLEFIDEQLGFLKVNAAIAEGYIHLRNEGALAYAVRSLAAHAKAIVEADAKLAELRAAAAKADLPDLQAEGGRMSKLGLEALRSFWRGLSETQKTTLGTDQWSLWAQSARAVDDKRLGAAPQPSREVAA